MYHHKPNTCIYNTCCCLLAGFHTEPAWKAPVLTDLDNGLELHWP